MAAPTIEALDMRGAGGKQWLMKLPRFLMEHLVHQAETGNGSNVGTAQKIVGAAASAGSQGSGTVGAVPAQRPGSSGTLWTITLPADQVPDGMPLEYTLNFSNDPPPATYIFRRAQQGVPAPAHEGRVEQRGEIRPREMSAAYRNLLKERGDRAGIRKTVETIQDDKELKRAKLNHRQVQMEEKAGKERKMVQREQNAKRRTKPQLSARELKDALLPLFARQRYWSRRDLLGEVGSVNEATLAACLEERCERVTARGTHYGDYQLKEAYRAGLPAAAASAGPSGLPLPKP